VAQRNAVKQQAKPLGILQNNKTGNLMFNNEIARYGHILYFQSIAELKQELAKKYLGFIWWFLDPILYMGVFYALFASGLRGGARGEDFIWFLFCGLVPWKWFASSVENCSRAITSNGSLISQVYFPKIILPATVFIAQTFKFLIVFIVLIVVLYTQGRFSIFNIHLLTSLVLLQGLVCFSFGAIAAALVPFMLDIRALISYSTIFLFFLSGIFFDVSQLSPEVAAILKYNPMIAIISSYRHILLGTPMPEIANMTIVYAEVCIALIVAAALYMRLDRVFARLVI
jgi:lipopolysaccharide transport system permease protein